MSVIHIENIEQLKKICEENKLVVIDFGAEWCMPCKMIAPYFNELSDKELHPKYSDIKFCKVDLTDSTDAVDEIIVTYDVSSLPTFYFIKEHKVIKKMVGATKETLVKNIDILAEN